MNQNIIKGNVKSQSNNSDGKQNSQQQPVSHRKKGKPYCLVILNKIIKLFFNKKGLFGLLFGKPSAMKQSTNGKFNYVFLIFYNLFKDLYLWYKLQLVST